MRDVDILIIGAGPAATAVLAGFSDCSPVNKSVLLLDGGCLSDPAVALSFFGPFEGRHGWSIQNFGLPAVRAFGCGGTSKLWHGGLFVPDVQDEILTAQGKLFDLHHALKVLSEAPVVATLPIAGGLAAAAQLASRNCELPRSDWRQMLVPYQPSQISPSQISGDFELSSSAAAAVGLEALANGRWLVSTISRDGFQDISAEHVVLAAGCLSTLGLLAKASGTPSVGFSDHLHVFVGTLSRRLLPSAIADRIYAEPVGGGYNSRQIWKRRVSVGGLVADVALSFRAVANPEFPRAGLRYGAFVGARAMNNLDKLLLGIKNPLTAFEMLAYKHGVQLPFDTILVHATIALKENVGSIGLGRLTFEPDHDLAAEMALSAFHAFVADCDIGERSYRAFETRKIRSSVISGAQFCLGAPLPDLIDRYVTTHNKTLHVADTASLSFTSVYNQVLVSLAHGYGLGRDLARSL